MVSSSHSFLILQSKVEENFSIPLKKKVTIQSTLELLSSDYFLYTFSSSGVSSLRWGDKNWLQFWGFGVLFLIFFFFIIAVVKVASCCCRAVWVEQCWGEGSLDTDVILPHGVTWAVHHSGEGEAISCSLLMKLAWVFCMKMQIFLNTNRTKWHADMKRNYDILCI